jgi:Helix-turn-helix domain
MKLTAIAPSPTADAQRLTDPLRATGMVGKGVLLECLDDARVEHRLLVSRHPIDLSHPKIREIVHADFTAFETLTPAFADIDALALEYLSDSSMEIAEVAYMVGYEDQNSFFRAFRQWEDRTPSAWRAEKRVTPRQKRPDAPRSAGVRGHGLAPRTTPLRLASHKSSRKVAARRQI